MDNSLHWLSPFEHIDSPEIMIELSKESDKPIYITDHHNQLLELKGEIDKIQTVQTWDTAKKITNPFEYIFLSLQKRTHRSIAACIPLSRSYFKMVELWDLLGPSLPEGEYLTAHSAEGPGGFLEAVMHRTHPKKCRMIAMTLRSTEKTIPGWRMSQQFLTSLGLQSTLHNLVTTLRHRNKKIQLDSKYLMIFQYENVHRYDQKVLLWHQILKSFF
jgi:hypothetical protein